MAPARGRVSKRNGGKGGKGGGGTKGGKGGKGGKVGKRTKKADEEAHKRACEAGRQRRRDEVQRAADAGEAPPPKRKVRLRGAQQRSRNLRIHDLEESALPRRGADDRARPAADDTPRKARELVSLMEYSQRQRREADAAEDAENVRFERTYTRHTQQRPGERYGAFRRRLREETRQEMLRASRVDNKQRTKTRAYWDKKRERAARKQRHRRGVFSDDEDGEGGRVEKQAASQFTGINPAVELLHERMLLAAEASRGRKKRRQRELDDYQTPWHSGGASDDLGVAMRPPTLSNKEKRVVASNAAKLLE